VAFRDVDHHAANDEGRTVLGRGRVPDVADPRDRAVRLEEPELEVERRARLDRGQDLWTATVEGARERLRAILMTAVRSRSSAWR
jgi:hypothetical protein